MKLIILFYLNFLFKLQVDCEKLLKQKDSKWEEKEAHHTAQIGVLTENIRTLKEDLTSEQKRRESLEQKLDEISGTKLGRNECSISCLHRFIIYLYKQIQINFIILNP